MRFADVEVLNEGKAKHASLKGSEEMSNTYSLVLHTGHGTACQLKLLQNRPGDFKLNDQKLWH